MVILTKPQLAGIIVLWPLPTCGLSSLRAHSANPVVPLAGAVVPFKVISVQAVFCFQLSSRQVSALS